MGILLSMAAWCQTSDATQYTRIFYDTRIVNGHSVEVSDAGTGKFIIAHRFGRVNSGAYNLYGLDDSNIRIGFDFGVKPWLTLGAGRSSFEKTYDAFAKGQILRQATGEKECPISLTVLGSVAYKSDTTRVAGALIDAEDKLFYTAQVLAAKRFGDRVSAQIMPSFVHRNLAPTRNSSNDVFSVGAALRVLVSKRITLNAEYYYVPEGQLDTQFNNSLALGIDLETKGHVFQFHFGNSRGMIEKFFITETTGSWENGDIHFGFNITRDFKMRGRR